MIKILRVSNHPSNRRHGVGLHPHKISETNKFKTIFISPSLENDDLYLSPKSYKLLISRVVFKKRPIKAPFIQKTFFHLKRIYKLFIFSFFCIRHARKNNVDIIHIHSPMYLIVALWAKFSGKLTCITYHGTDYLRIKDSRIYRIFSKKYLDIGFCISPHMIDKMAMNHNEVNYVPNGVDPLLFYNKEEKRQKILLAVGSLKKEKSYKNLIKAFKKAAESFKDYQLHIAGDGHLRSELELLVQKEGLKEKVRFCGNLNMKQLVDKYNSATCFILSSYTEGFPKVVLEAIFSGCKVVATDVGSIKTFLPEKYLIPNDSINNLSKYIVKIIEEKNYEIDVEQLKLRFTWSNVINNYEKSYENNLKVN